MIRHLTIACALIFCLTTTAASVEAQGGARAWRPMLLGAQTTVIVQRLDRFAAAYSGANSLTSAGDTEWSESYGVYGGMRLSPALQGYLDVEMLRGHAVGGGRGLGGVTNGDVVAPDPASPLSRPFVARAYLRYLLPLSDARDSVTRAVDQLPGALPADRVEVKVGRMAATDDFDPNRYGNNARLQFMNWALYSNTAWDYAADARGYATGATVGLVHPRWSIRAGSFLMAGVGATDISSQVRRSRGDDVQLSVAPGAYRTVARVFLFRNIGSMSDYRQALADSAASRGAPSLPSTARFGRSKTGGGINVEQPLSPHGNFGVLLRAGWNDGRGEGFATTEVDRDVSFATQYRLRRFSWRPEDYIGAGVARHWLTAPHRDFLAAGGTGFFLGDGALRYGPESIGEAYYRAQVGPWVHLGPDLQLIRNPGYNRDRGPAVAIAFRVHAEY